MPRADTKLPDASAGVWRDQPLTGQNYLGTANPRKLEHGFRRIGARIPYALP